MTPLVLRTNDIEMYHLEIFQKVKRTVNQAPNSVTCHSLCKLIADGSDGQLEHVKGTFGGYEHSWLRFKVDTEVLIDAYPIAVASGPILLYMAMVWMGIYKEENDQNLEEEK